MRFSVDSLAHASVFPIHAIACGIFRGWAPQPVDLAEMRFIRFAALGGAIRVEDIAAVGNSGRRGIPGRAHRLRFGPVPALAERG